MCRICAERALAREKKRPESFVGLKPEDIGETYHRSKTFTYYSIHPMAEKRFFRDVPRGQRGGGTLHAAMIGFLVDRWRREGCFCIPDLGEDPGKKLPDILVYPLSRKAGRRTVHPKLWDTPHRFAIEVEADPAKHPDRVISNWEKCKAWGMPVIFVAPTFESSRKILEMLLSQGAKVVADAPSEHAPGVATVLFVHPESGTQVAVVDPNQPPPPHEAAEAEAKAEPTTTEPKYALVAEEKPRPERPLSEPGPSVESGETAEREALIRAFADWNLTVKRFNGQPYIVAQRTVEGATVEKTVCLLDAETKRIIELLKLEVSAKPKQAGPLKKPRPQAKAKEAVT